MENTKDKNLEIIIYVSDLTLYSQGVDEWVELNLLEPTEAKRKYDAFQKKHKGHEFFISDTSMTNNLGIREFNAIECILDWAEEYLCNWNEEQISIFSALIVDGAYDWASAADIVENYAYTVIEHNGRGTEEECVGQYYAEFLDIPDHIEPYFDYERYGRDVLIESESITNADYTIIISR